ncbi:GlxA family transcriptional regulator [Polycladidibacter hongkongensis]|uniref:GlxA family transcriptional regulator n=1 Tax=Polycladidibacter hongkongensis TaxID=1647556 RepID=UPI000ABC90E5|nr:GlxA family transcriptional regulator [Pseudovibrio hongkongensis]
MSGTALYGVNEKPQAVSSASSPIRIGLILFPEFSMMAFASFSDPMRAANRLANEVLYEWSVLSDEGGLVPSSGGHPINTISIDSAPEFDRIFIIASMDTASLQSKRIANYLRTQARRGAIIGAISNGSYVLARGGLLNGYRCTLHWESLSEFLEEFPDINVCREIYVQDRRRWTCAGGTAAIDLMLMQISSDYDANLASNIAEQFLHSRIRGARENQRMEIQLRYNINDSRMVTAISHMEENLEHPLEIQKLAKLSNLSQRQLERLWHQFFGITPQQFYSKIRLKEAQRLLKESTEAISSIALRCGFVSSSHLGSAYKKQYGLTPGQERVLVREQIKRGLNPN